GKRYKDGVVGERFAGVLAGCPLGADVPTGTVDKNVDRTETLVDLFDDPLDRLLAREVAPHRQNLSTMGIGNVCSDGLQRLSFAEGLGRIWCRAVDDGMCAGPCELIDSFTPDAV